MPDTAMQIVGMKDTSGCRPRMPPRSRLGKTWQDRNWRRKLLDQMPPGMFSARHAERNTGSGNTRRALPSGH